MPQPKPVKVAIIQSSYIPWKGYFDLINAVDHFVLFDDVQYTRRDWRNRNKVKTANGPTWLTIPVEVKGKYFQRIRDTKIADNAWADNHFHTIKHSYSKAECWKQSEKWLQSLYEQASQFEFLSEVNHLFITSICERLGIKTTMHWSSDFTLAEGKSEKLLSICEQLHGSSYVSGPAAKGYLNEECFTEVGIEVEWANYDDYPEYNQLHPPFCHTVSMLDLLINTGPDANNYLKSFLGKSMTENPATAEV